jgi:hypothetical protein
MVCFNLYGGLGNQLFIYSFAKSIEDETRQPYCLNYLGKLGYFKLSVKENYLNFIKKIFFHFFIRKTKKHRILFFDDGWKTYSPSIAEEKDCTIYGYFQSENYFKSKADKIRKLLTVKTKFRKAFDQQFGADFSRYKTVAVHLRRTDYQHSFAELQLEGPDLTLPIDYYHRALEQIPQNDNTKFFFLSDDIDFAKKHFANIQNAYYSGQSPIIDFQLMMNADICITANSTFSWWAAWLNKKQQKIVYAPKYFLGFKVQKEFPVNIIPSEWIQIEVS